MEEMKNSDKDKEIPGPEPSGSIGDESVLLFFHARDAC